VHHEHLDAGLGEPQHLGAKAHLGTQALVGGVVGVSGDDEEVDLPLDTDVDDSREGRVGCVGKLAPDAWIVGRDAGERRVEMQVSGVDERTPSRTDSTPPHRS